MGIVPNALVVNPSKVPAKTVADFIADARANPGKLTAATQGNGTTSHLTSEMFQMMAKVKFVHVPYRGSAPALQGLLAGDCDVMFDNLGVSLPLVKSGQLKLLAVGDAAADGVAAGRADHRRDAAGLCLRRLVRGRRAAEDAARRSSTRSTPTSPRRSASARCRASVSTNSRPSRSAARREASARFMREEVDRWRAVIKAAGREARLTLEWIEGASVMNIH